MILLFKISKYSVKCAQTTQPGDTFTNDLLIVIQIRAKFHFTLVWVLMYWSQPNFAHDTITVLWWHVQHYVVTYLTGTEL